MQSSHDVLRQNILSNWFATSSLQRWMHWVKNSIKLPSSGKIQTWFTRTLAIWIPSSSTFSAILTAECGLRPIRFCQFFGEEASAYVTGQQANFGLTRRREISIHCTGYGESSKESSVFFLWAKESFSLWNCSSRYSTLFASQWSAWPVLKCNQGSKVFVEFCMRYIFYSMVREITFLKGNLCIYKCFIDV